MDTITDPQNERLKSSTRIAREQVDRNLHRLEHSMDELADHLSHTHDTVRRIRAPERWVRNVAGEIKRQPALYAGIAAALGAIFLTTNWLSQRRKRP